MDDAMMKKLRGALTPHIESGYAAGLVALVAGNDDSAVIALGDQAVGGPSMDRRSLFRLASITKPITAAAAMMLIEDGKLKLDEPVDRLLPELAERRVLRSLRSELDDTVPAARPITVEDLLTFRMGLGIVLAAPGTYPIQRRTAELGLMGFGPPDPAAPLDPDQWIAAVGALPLMAQPGEAWMYTTASNVLGVLIARASGQSFPNFMAERIFGPLGMADTGFFAPAEKAHRLVDAYSAGPGGLALVDAAAGSAWTRPPPFPAGDAGLVSTADDLLAFSRLLLNRGRANGRQLLSEAAVAAMTRNHLTAAQRAGGAPILDGDCGWGYGMAVVMRRTEIGVPAGAIRWDGGFGTSWVADPASGLTAICLTQTVFQSPAPPTVHQDFQRAVFAG